MSDEDERDNVVSLCKHREQTGQDYTDFLDGYELTNEDAQAFLKILYLLQTLSISETCGIKVDGELITFEVKHSLGSQDVEDTGITQHDVISKRAEMFIPWSSIGKEDLVDDEMEKGEILVEGAEDLIDALCCLFPMESVEEDIPESNTEINPESDE